MVIGKRPPDPPNGRSRDGLTSVGGPTRECPRRTLPPARPEFRIMSVSRKVIHPDCALTRGSNCPLCFETIKTTRVRHMPTNIAICCDGTANGALLTYTGPVSV
jgi:hypothetical protein